MENDATNIRAINPAFNDIHGHAVIVPEKEGDTTLEFLIKTAVPALDALCLHTHASADDNDRREAFVRIRSACLGGLAGGMLGLRHGPDRQQLAPCPPSEPTGPHWRWKAWSDCGVITRPVLELWCNSRTSI